MTTAPDPSVAQPRKRWTIAAILLGLAAVVVVALAIPGVTTSRISANEAAAAAVLKFGFFPAQIAAQNGCHIDQDRDGNGEFATLGELIGAQDAGGKKLSLLSLQLQNDPNNGYHFRVYLPDGTGGAMTSDRQARVANPAAANAQERAFVVYAWPATKDSGSRIFALCQDGQLRSPVTHALSEPQWNEVFGGSDFTTEPAWPVYRR